MYSISKIFTFCYGHRLLKDEGKCGHLHGHTAKTTLVLEGDELDRRGMVFHFDRLKETMGAWIEENLDHTLLLSKDDPVIKALEKTGERFRTMSANPTAENIARMIFDAASELGLPVARVELWESETSKATYEGHR